MKRTVLVFTILCFCAACDTEDDFLADYNRAELFAAPTAAELDAVRADWSLRDLGVSEYKEEQTVELSDEKTVFKLISYQVSGLREYAALFIPKSGEDLPVRIYVNGFGLGITENSITVAPDFSTGINSILAIPALRGQSLKVNVEGKTYTTPVSDGIHCDAFDGAADDAIALLNLIESIEPKANVNRTAVRGGSRGATVALLVAVRDKRVKMAFAVAGPTNLLDLTVRNENDPTYQCQFLDDLVNNNRTIAEARQKMLASSPLFFAADLPQTQLHLGKNDRIVPVAEGEKLKQKMEELGNPDLLELFIYEDRGHSDIATGNTALNSRIDSLLSRL